MITSRTLKMRVGSQHQESNKESRNKVYYISQSLWIGVWPMVKHAWMPPQYLLQPLHSWYHRIKGWVRPSCHQLSPTILLTTVATAIRKNRLEVKGMHGIESKARSLCGSSNPKMEKQILLFVFCPCSHCWLKEQLKSVFYLLSPGQNVASRALKLISISIDFCSD